MIDKAELTERDLIFDTYTDAMAALKNHLVQDADYSPEEALNYIEDTEVVPEDGSVYSEVLDRYYVWLSDS